jgi:broad specificity phosphatase PhoE
LTKVFLVRHGATDWNLYKRAQGQADIPLDKAGELQALDTAKHLAALDIAAVYSSDLSRARDTAKAIANLQGLEVIEDPRFREIDQGEWTGLPVAEIARKWPDLWGSARHYSTRPGGESPKQVRDRALAGLKDAVERNPEGTIVVVSHGGTIRWISAEAMGYDDHGSAGLRGLGNGGVIGVKADVEHGKLILWDLERLDGATPDLDDPND